jgi:hypothetical protein
MNADGTMKTDGSVARFVQRLGDMDSGMSTGIADQIIADGNRLGGEQGQQIKEYGERLKDAINVFQEFRNAGYKMPGAKSADLPPEVKAELDRARARETELNAREATNSETQRQVFEEQLFTDTIKQCEPLISETLNKTSLTDYEKKNVARDIYKEVADLMTKDRHFVRQKEQIAARGFTEDNRKQLSVLNKQTFSTYVHRVMGKLLEEAGVKQISANEKRQGKIDTQINDDRMNPTAASGGVNTPSAMTPAQMREKAEKNIRARNGDQQPSTEDILNETLVLKGMRKSA